MPTNTPHCLELPNLGTSTVHILSAIGITTKPQLVQLGAPTVYNQIRRRGIRTSKVMLYALHAAILDCRWQELSDTVKADLVYKADIQLQASQPSAPDKG